MSLASEITRLQNAKSALKTSIEAKGVTVSDTTLISDYSAYVDQIPTGGGGGGGNEDLINLIERDVTTFNIPSGTTKIGKYTFGYCDILKTVIIPNSVTSIGDYAFNKCSGLTSVTIPNSVTSIGDSAFYDCNKLASVGIPNSVTEIGTNAFRNCSALTNIVIPNSVTSIGNYAFGDCTAITSVEIGNSVTSIGNYAFGDCNNLTSVTIKATTPPTLGKSFASANTNAFDNTNDCPIYVPAESVDAYMSETNWRIYRSRIQAIPAV